MMVKYVWTLKIPKMETSFHKIIERGYFSLKRSEYIQQVKQVKRSDKPTKQSKFQTESTRIG